MTDMLAPYEWLCSADGASQLASARELVETGQSTFRVGEILRERLDPDQAALVLTQLDLQNRAREKFSAADHMLFTRAGLEQATSASIADWRAQRFAGFERIIDLCCGIGGDAMALASLPHAPVLTMVDRDPVHLLLAEHNVRTVVPNAEIHVIESDVLDVDLTHEHAIFIDPARRTDRGRMEKAESDPPLTWAIGLAEQGRALGIKAAPGIDHDAVPTGWELEMIASGFDLKEAVLWSPGLAEVTSPRPARSATVIDDSGPHHFLSRHCDGVANVELRPGNWLLDLNPAITRAGLVEDFACETHTGMIDGRIGFLVADQFIDTRFSRAMRILDVLPWHEKRIKSRLRELEAGPIDIRRRGLAGDVDAITKRLRGKGDRRLTIAMTRVDDEPAAIICEHPAQR